MLIASLQVLYQCRFLWEIEEAGLPWMRVGLVLGSVALTNLAVYLLGLGSGRRPFGLLVGVVLASTIAPLLGALGIAMACGLLRLWWDIWEVGRCLF
ncbi:MAG: hypothetical protein JSW27_19915 [Phycisphaerales bacterium]|nr:MAG: hypothetical protein JSW27_19915 [Phycisphaerales bacterium]